MRWKPNGSVCQALMVLYLGFMFSIYPTPYAICNVTNHLQRQTLVCCSCCCWCYLEHLHIPSDIIT